MTPARLNRSQDLVVLRRRCTLTLRAVQAGEAVEAVLLGEAAAQPHSGVRVRRQSAPAVRPPSCRQKRPSEMCALDRPDRLVIRPHRPPVPKTCKPLYPCIAWELVAPASCSHAAARRCAASCSARGGCSCGTEAESDDAELRRIENAIAARTKATMLLRNWRWRPTPTGELASSTHSKLHWPTRRCSIRGQSRPIVKHSAHIGVIVE